MSLARVTCTACHKTLRVKNEATCFHCPACGAAVQSGGPSNRRLLIWMTVACGVAAVALGVVIAALTSGREMPSPTPTPEPGKVAVLELPKPSARTLDEAPPPPSKPIELKPIEPRFAVIDGKTEPLPEMKAAPEIAKGVARSEPPPMPPEVKAIPAVASVKKPAGLELGPLPHPGVDQKAVDQAIARGVAFLKARAMDEGMLGAKALAGLALLHCDVPPDDAAVQRLAADVREHAARRISPYDLAACIWFLDRMGDKRDSPLIRHIGLRLIANLKETGGWGYSTAQITPDQENRLVKMLGGDVALPVAVAKGPALAPVMPVFAADKIPDDLRLLPVFRYAPGGKLPKPLPGPRNFVNRVDNSITQFGVLGLLVSKRHGVPADRALLMAEERFRSTQRPNGSWVYGGVVAITDGVPVETFDVVGLADSGTCAGLLSLASAATTRAALVADPAVERALTYLVRRLDTFKPLPEEVRRKRAAAAGVGFKAMAGLEKMKAAPGKVNPLDLVKAIDPGALFMAGGAGGKITALIDSDAGGDLYFLWSLERTAVAYGLKTVGKRDWYAFGAPLIIACQEADGAWREAYPGACDTAFALLFLRRANLFVETTVALQTLQLPLAVAQRTQVNSVSPGELRGPGMAASNAAQAVGPGNP